MNKYSCIYINELNKHAAFNSLATAGKSVVDAGRSIASVTKPVVSTAADINSASHVPHAAPYAGSANFKKNYALGEGISSLGGLVHEGTHALKHVAPAVSQLATKAPAVISSVASGVGTAAKFLGRVAPWAWAGNMAMEAVDVARDPQKAIQDTENALEGKGGLARAWHGFTNPIKSGFTAASGLNSLFNPYSEHNKSIAEGEERNARLDKQYQERMANRNPYPPPTSATSSFLPQPKGMSRALPFSQNNPSLRNPAGSTQPIQKTSSIFSNKSDTEGQRSHGLIKDILYAGAGAKIFDVSEGSARGKYVAYHGSTPEAMEQMRRTGIKTMQEMADAGKSHTGEALKAWSPEVFDESKNMAFVGDKGIARTFINQAAVGKLPVDPMEKMEVLQNLMNKDRWKFLKNSFFGSPLRTEFSVSELGKRIVENPEAVQVTKRLGNELGPIINQMTGLGSSRGIIGGVRPEEIVGNKNFKLFSMSGIKAKPLRFARGFGGVLAGSALIATALKNRYDSLNKKAYG